MFLCSPYIIPEERDFFIYSLDWLIATDMCNSELGGERGRAGMVL